MSLDKDRTDPRNTIKRILERVVEPSQITYLRNIGDSYVKAFECATTAMSKGIDLDREPQSHAVCDIADRLEMITGISGISGRLTSYDSKDPVAKTALKIAEDIALGHFGFFEKEETLNSVLKAALALVTSCALAIPVENITKVVIKKNGDGTSYPAVVFGQISGIISPLQAAFMLLVVDRVRLIIGLDKYHIDSTGENETARFLEELRLCQRETGPFQFKVSEADLQSVLHNIPVEVDGYGTSGTEVLVNRGLSRIKEDRVRGGALHVLVDGVIGRSSRLLDLARELQIQEWDWLSSLEGGTKIRKPEDPQSYILDAKPGRPVLSLPDKQGSFRLRYGRAQDTGFGCFGFHPAVLELLDFPITTGTQIKISILGRTGSVAMVDSIEPPIVRLHNGDTRRIESADEARALKDSLDCILHLGDILTSPSEFLSSGLKLDPSGYVEEWWITDVQSGGEQRHLTLEQLSALATIDINRLQTILANPISTTPTLLESLQLCNALAIPLHPHYTFFWDLLAIKDIFSLRDNIVDYQNDEYRPKTLAFLNSSQIKRILETIGIPHKVSGSLLVVSGDDAESAYLTLAPEKTIPLGTNYSDTLTLLKFLSGLEIRKKSSTYVGVALRRIELANERKMRPPIHVLFPVGSKVGPSRDLLQFSHSPSTVDLLMQICPSCGSPSPYNSCPFCESPTSRLYFCTSCRKESRAEKCPDCGSVTLPYTTAVPRVLDILRAASASTGLQPYPPLKGVVRLANRSLTPERLEKGIMRQRHSLTSFKDGTIRYDTINAPLTHFKPSQLHTDIKTLQNLGYVVDRYGRPLESEEQTLELKPQDIILPEECGDHLKRLAAYLDDLLTRFFKTEAFYDIHKQDDLLGALVVGISPKASIGVVGRIIGFANARVCFAHPMWHAAKHRDCGGDADSLTLLLDVLLNYSPRLCPDQLEGLLDTPTMIEPIILQSTTTRTPTLLDTLSSYPQEFFIKASEKVSSQLFERMFSSASRSDNSEAPELIYEYTHWSSNIVPRQPWSQYAAPGPMPDKVNKQIAVASRIQAVDVDALVSSLLNNYLVKEIIKNLEAYSTQRFRCKGCGEAYRRPPLKGNCLTCGRELLPTVTMAAVEKYALLANELTRSHKIPQPIKDKVALTLENLQLLSESKKQTSIADYV